jgi:hypothetical protein
MNKNIKYCKMLLVHSSMISINQNLFRKLKNLHKFLLNKFLKNGTQQHQNLKNKRCQMF